MFQSQTRSRSTCDAASVQGSVPRGVVSISDEKPLHMRLWATRAGHGSLACFNLRREAAPHATSARAGGHPGATQFQSQTRSRSTCDLVLSYGICVFL